MKTSGRRPAMTAEPVLDLSRRDERALSMKVSGIPIERIAATFGWTPEQAHDAIERALVRVTVDRNPEGVRYQRGLAERRLDGLLEAIWPSATDPTGHPIIQQGAIKVALGIHDRQASLFGTNAPKETIVTHNVGPDQVAATIERLFAFRSGVVEADVLGVIEAGPVPNSTNQDDADDDPLRIIDAEIVD
jgi:hypothetical protein